MTAITGEAASTQEDNVSPPPPLQFPTVPGSTPVGEFTLTTLRADIEQAGNKELCKILTKEADPDVIFEPDFTFAQCDPAIAAKVRNGSGSLRWAAGARPTQCGRDCLGRPSTDQTRALDRPNRRFANVHGRLTFRAVNVGPTPFERDIIFPLEIRFECRVESGLKVGEVRIRSIVGQPFLDEPGLLESIADVLLAPLNLSRSIDNGIRAAVSSSGTTQSGAPGPCTSIGAVPDPQDFHFDRFVWDIPPKTVHGALHPTISASLGSTATIVFDSIVRNRTLEPNPPTAPLQFTVYVNGNPALIPRFGTISLPPTGGKHDQKYCKTVNVEGAENLQILFVDNLGGAVWSQFPRRVDFGNGPPRRMTTGRQYFEAPRPPVKGEPHLPSGTKPRSFIAREFEVRYRIDFQAAMALTPATTGSTGGTHAPLGGGKVTANPPQPPAPPCIKI